MTVFLRERVSHFHLLFPVTILFKIQIPFSPFPYSCLHLHQILTDFQTSFVSRINNNFVTKYKSHVKYFGRPM